MRRDKLLVREAKHPDLQAAKTGGYSEKDEAGVVHDGKPRPIKSQIMKLTTRVSRYPKRGRERSLRDALTSTRDNPD